MVSGRSAEFAWFTWFAWPEQPAHEVPNSLGSLGSLVPRPFGAIQPPRAAGGRLARPRWGTWTRWASQPLEATHSPSIACEGKNPTWSTYPTFREGRGTA